MKMDQKVKISDAAQIDNEAVGACRWQRDALATSNKKLLGAKGIATRSKDATNGAPGLTTRNKKLVALALIGSMS